MVVPIRPLDTKWTDISSFYAWISERHSYRPLGEALQRCTLWACHGCGAELTKLLHHYSNSYFQPPQNSCIGGSFLPLSFDSKNLPSIMAAIECHQSHCFCAHKVLWCETWCLCSDLGCVLPGGGAWGFSPGRLELHHLLPRQQPLHCGVESVHIALIAHDPRIYWLL